MPAVVMEDMIPVRYESWQDWRAMQVDAARARAERPLVEPQTAPCGHCWGQRRIWHPAPNGEGLIPEVCMPCLGTGRVVSTRSARRT